MRNVSPPRHRPNRYPRRGLAAAVLTAGGLALLLSFRTPSELPLLGGAESFAPITETASGGAAATTTPTGQGGGASNGDSQAAAVAVGSTPDASSAANAAGNTAGSPAPPSQVYAGRTVRTPYGPVQVEVTMADGTITDIQALQLPFDRSYSARISRAVEPMLREETLRVQSAQIRLVSGATYTSKGYAMSLQSALDLASQA